MAHDRSGPIKPKFGVDLDGCVYNFDYGARVSLRLQGYDVPVVESRSWGDLQQSIPEDAWHWMWNDGVREVFRCAPPYKGAIKALRQMQNIVQICIITHRPLSVADVTLRRLADDKITPYAVIHAQHADKSTIMPDCIGYVEDRKENVFDLATTGKPVWMPIRPYNYSTTIDDGQLPNVHPFHDWQEVVASLTS